MNLIKAVKTIVSLISLNGRRVLIFHLKNQDNEVNICEQLFQEDRV